MKVVILLSLFVLAASRPQYYNSPTPGPVYYKPIEPQLFYPSYFQGQFRPARSDNTAEPVEAAPEAPVDASPREGRAEEVSDAAPVVAVEPEVVQQAVEREGRAEEPAPEAKAAPVYPAPAPAAPAYPAPAPAYSGPAAYSFEWLVKDDYTKNDYGQKESRSGANTQGSYHVALPDGRIQTITYTVDGYGGYVANVQYSGEAQYPDTPAYKPAAKAYKPAPAPAYKPAPAPTYKPAPAPTYKPAPAPVYKAAPAPVYKPHPAPAYPIAPAASVRRYSFRTLSNEPAPAEEARSAEGVAVEVLLDEEEIAAPVEVQETARSNEGIAVEAPVFPDAPAAPVEDLIPEESVRSNVGNLVAIIPETTVAPVDLVVIEESSINNEENAKVAPIIPEAPAAPVEVIVEESAPTTEADVIASTIIPEAPAAPAVQVIDPTTTIAAPVEEETETTTLVNLLAIVEVPSESDNAPAQILEVVESNNLVEPREEKSLDVVVEEAVDEAALAPIAPVAVEEAPLNYRYYYRY